MNENKIDYIEYDEKDIIDRPMWYHKRGLSQTATGYGSKLNTGKMLRVGKKEYRIYAICYSNAASNYIIKNGKRLFLR